MSETSSYHYCPVSWHMPMPALQSDGAIHFESGLNNMEGLWGDGGFTLKELTISNLEVAGESYGFI